MDVFSSAKRSEIMSRISSRGNAATELRLREILRARRITGWRRHYPVAGTPDFAFRKERVAIFVDGCYWHGCKKCQRVPKTNLDYWLPKFEANRARDKRVAGLLRRSGWTVLRIAQCDLRNPERVGNRIAVKLNARRSMLRK